MNRVLSAIVLASALIAPAAQAQQAQGSHDAHHPNAALSDAQVRAAVEFMVSQSK